MPSCGLWVKTMNSMGWTPRIGPSSRGASCSHPVDHCTDSLRVGGILLAAPSHGDVAMASIDPRYRLVSVIESRSGNYRIKTTGLDSYLVPKSETEITPAMLHERGRGVPYTNSPFGYLFQRVN